MNKLRMFRHKLVYLVACSIYFFPTAYSLIIFDDF